jgi:hypothetical protein
MKAFARRPKSQQHQWSKNVSPSNIADTKMSLEAMTAAEYWLQLQAITLTSIQEHQQTEETTTTTT